MSFTQAFAAAAFTAIVLLWGGPRAYESGTRPSRTEGAAAASSPGSPGTASEAAAPSTVAIGDSGAAPTSSSPNAQHPEANPGAGPAPAHASAPPQTGQLSDAEQIALQRQLEAEGASYVQALQAHDAAAITSMLSARCAGTDVPALIARRRAEIAAVAGAPIEQLKALNQLVAHFDPSAGEAHTILELDNAGTRVELPVADGWLLEGGQWKSVNC